MADKEELLEKRKELKKKKPDFNRHDSHKNKSFGSSWRRPKGLQNKLRLEKRGYGRPVKTGWGSPKEVRGLHPSGLEPVRVHNTSQLDEVGEGQGIIIASSVGDRKRVKIIEEAQENDIKILNLDGEEYLEKVEERLERQKEQRKERKQRKEEAGKEGEKKAEEKEERIDPEDKKEEEKEQMEKVVTKK